jgi:hypothetical protein
MRKILTFPADRGMFHSDGADKFGNFTIIENLPRSTMSSCYKGISILQGFIPFEERLNKEMSLMPPKPFGTVVSPLPGFAEILSNHLHC